MSKRTVGKAKKKRARYVRHSREFVSEGTYLGEPSDVAITITVRGQHLPSVSDAMKAAWKALIDAENKGDL